MQSGYFMLLSVFSTLNMFLDSSRLDFKLTVRICVYFKFIFILKTHPTVVVLVVFLLSKDKQNYWPLNGQIVAVLLWPIAQPYFFPSRTIRSLWVFVFKRYVFFNVINCNNFLKDTKYLILRQFLRYLFPATWVKVLNYLLMIKPKLSRDFLPLAYVSKKLPQHRFAIVKMSNAPNTLNTFRIHIIVLREYEPKIKGVYASTLVFP